MTSSWVVSGFEPFDRALSNPSEAVGRELVRRLLDDPIASGSSVAFALLPVDYERTPQALDELVTSFPDSHFLQLGFSASARKMRLEKYAINLIHAPIPDNSGRLVWDAPVLPGGDEFLSSAHPLTEWLKELGHPDFSLSTSAGTYLCNLVYYLSLQRLGPERALFVHVPSLDEIPLERQVAALRDLIKLWHRVAAL